MPQEILNIILSAVSIIVTGLVGWGVKALTSWLNTKIKDAKMSNCLSQLTMIVSDAVMSVFQMFVDTLKKNGKFDQAAQTEAKEAAMNIVKTQLTPELSKFIKENYGDVEKWLGTKIEAVICDLKASGAIASN